MLKLIKLLSMTITTLLLTAAAHAATPDEIEISSISFTSTSFTAINGVNFSTISGSGVVKDAWFLDGSQTNIIAGGQFTKAYASALVGGSINAIEALVNGVQQSPRVFMEVNNLAFTGTSVNHIFRLDWDPAAQEFTFSKLTAGYNGSGDGVGFKINKMFIPPGGNSIYLGGMFTTAGGWSNGRGFAVYRFSGGNGWSDLQSYPMYVTGPSYAEITDIELVSGGSIKAIGSSDVASYVDYGGSHATSPGNFSAIWSPSLKVFTAIVSP